MTKGWTTLLLPILLLMGCSDSSVGPRLPEVPVSILINVGRIEYSALRQDGGHVYLEGGYKGILLVRQHANLYTAFERACPYHPTASCAQVQVDPSNLFLTDTCCGSQFSFQGDVMAGPAVLGLRQYRTSLTGANLYITN